MTAEYILKELNITEEVVAIFPYGSRVYGLDTEKSDYDYIVVFKKSILPNGAFRNNAVSNKDKSIQAVIYSRSGFIDAINNYEIGALECLSLDSSEVVLKKWPFKITKWNEKDMIKKIIQKASASWHIADEQSKNGFKDNAKKGIFHALRILEFGLQLKNNQKVVDFKSCNNLYLEFKNINPEDFDTRNYTSMRDDLMGKLRSGDMTYPNPSTK